MASETGRIVRRKRIKLPNGNTCDIPVIYQITFADPADRGQDTEYTIDNTTDSDRTVRVASTFGDEEPPDESGGGGQNNANDSDILKVERIDKFQLQDAADRGQDIWPEPDNKTFDSNGPPFFTTHVKTHIVKFVARNTDDTDDTSTWIKSELIDQISFTDSGDRGQETQFTLTNPSQDNPIDGMRFGTDDDGIPTISLDPSAFDEITSGVGIDSDGNGDPVRTDPFQNIISWSGEQFVITISWGWYSHVGLVDSSILGPHTCAELGPATIFFANEPGDVLLCGWFTKLDVLWPEPDGSYDGSGNGHEPDYTHWGDGQKNGPFSSTGHAHASGCTFVDNSVWGVPPWPCIRLDKLPHHKTIVYRGTGDLSASPACQALPVLQQGFGYWSIGPDQFPNGTGTYATGSGNGSKDWTQTGSVPIGITAGTAKDGKDRDYEPFASQIAYRIEDTGDRVAFADAYVKFKLKGSPTPKPSPGTLNVYGDPKYPNPPVPNDDSDWRNWEIHGP
jgi:hypothetical protein